MGIEYSYQCDSCLKKVKANHILPSGWAYVSIGNKKMIACDECKKKLQEWFGIK